VEAKEGVKIKEENQTLATITLQNYFRMYDKLAGMTGTAATEAAELMATYELGVVPIPTNVPVQRIDQADLIYKGEVGKFDAVTDDIAERYEAGQPVLVGTVSVEKSEYLSRQLSQRGIDHEVLNAKQHTREALIVTQAGRKHAVTVATNMAGRGVDIKLGGDPEGLAQHEVVKEGHAPEVLVDVSALPLPLDQMPEDFREARGKALARYQELLAEFEQQCKAEGAEVRALGGLYVIGSERHESRRIDNQLRGRSGRQGDPGESRFYLSLQDELMRLFKSDWVDWVLTTLKVPDDVPIENKRVTNSIASAQSQVEAQNFDSRKNVLKYDDVMSRQREVIYAERRAVLEGADLHDQIRTMIDDVVASYVGEATAGFPEEWDLEKLWTALKQLWPVSIDRAALVEEAGGVDGLEREDLVDRLRADAHAAYEGRETEFGAEVMRELERRVVLSVLDRKWREHLYEMDYLREGIGLRAYSQRDPLVEYQREGFDLFTAMMDAIKEESIGFLFNIEVEVGSEDEEEEELVPDGETPFEISAAAAAQTSQANPLISAKGLDRPRQPEGELTYSAPSETGGAEVHRERERPEDAYAGIGRNVLCPCGSGKKYKRCHGSPNGPDGTTARIS
jgi:preprotein translocase subunit SecA